MIPGFVEFEFDLPDALLQSLISVFDKMNSTQLLPENLSMIPDAQGVYQLLQDGQIVYIGKTDGDAGLKQRLTRHATTILHRRGLPAESITFKAVRVFVFTAMDLETELIRHYGKISAVPWNKSGFGSNDPGRNRDNTNLKAGHFDLQYPIDLDELANINIESGETAAAILIKLRTALPYTIRFETEASRRPHQDLLTTRIMEIPPAPRTTRQIIMSIINNLPQGWQATSLAGRIILYREHKPYSSGTIIGRSEATHGIL